MIGFDFGHSQLNGRDGLTVFAVDRETLGGLSIREYAAAHGEIPVTDFRLHDMPALVILVRGLKRLEVQLISRHVPAGVAPRQILRDDLNYSGE